MAAGAIPYFEDLLNCPSKTLWRMPKAEFIIAKKMYDEWSGSNTIIELWKDNMEQVRIWLTSYLTTEAMAKYILDTAGVS
jgi:hypothetical protein